MVGMIAAVAFGSRIVGFFARVELSGSPTGRVDSSEESRPFASGSATLLKFSAFCLRVNAGIQRFLFQSKGFVAGVPPRPA